MGEQEQGAAIRLARPTDDQPLLRHRLAAECVSVSNGVSKLWSREAQQRGDTP